MPSAALSCEARPGRGNRPGLVYVLAHAMTCEARMASRLNATGNVCAVVNCVTGKATVTRPVLVPARLRIGEIDQAGYGGSVAVAAAGPGAARGTCLRRRLATAGVTAAACEAQAARTGRESLLRARRAGDAMAGGGTRSTEQVTSCLG